MIDQRLWFVPAIVLIAATNVGMNALLKRAANVPGSATALLTLPVFWGALGAGSLSIVLLLAIYRAGIPLARAMLLLGATSVLLGVGLGTLLGDRLARSELALLVVLIAFYVAAWLVRA